MKSSVGALLCRSEITMGLAATESETQVQQESLGPMVAGVRGRQLLAKGNVGLVTVTNGRVKAVIRIV